MKASVNNNDVLRIINADYNDPFNILGMHFVDLNKRTESDTTDVTYIKDTTDTTDTTDITDITDITDTTNKPTCKTISVRAFLPNAENVKVIDLGRNDKSYDESDVADCNTCCYEMNKVHKEGFFEALIHDKKSFFMYKLEIKDYEGNTYRISDPYCFLPALSEYDLYLFNGGNHHKIYEKLGAHICTINEVEGTIFTVWAPCAKRVSVVGNFNQWDGRRHQMRNYSPSGVWEIFIPEITEGEVYKFEIKTANNELYIKSDPYAFYSELRPKTASIVYKIDGYKWNDDEWMRERDKSSFFKKPISIYEVHLGSWTKGNSNKEGDIDRFLTYTEFADKLVDYVKEMGHTHIELLPIAEHPFDGSWGYQITGYYSLTSRYGKPEEFMYFVDRCHQEGIGVIVDWVPAHFPKDGHGLARFDGSALYEHYDPKQGEQPDWGTHVFNFGRHEVRNFLVSNALFWFEKYHIDGLRVDAVASMLYLDYGKKEGQWIKNKWGGKENIDAIDFLKQLNSTVFNYYPGVMMIAEESTSWPLVSKPPYMGGLGFSFKWNMGWMNDYLKYISLDPIYRKYNHNSLTFSIMYAFSENFILVLSHDEVVHGKCSMINKMPGDYNMKFAGLRVSYGYMYGHPGKKLLFMGGEFGQFIEWDHQRSLDWHLLDYDMHKKLQKYVKDLNTLYKTEKALYECDFNNEGFEWIDCNDSEHGVVSFIRKAKDSNDMLIIVCNFTPVEYSNYRIGAPYNTYYKEIFNSDSEYYGGNNIGNFGGMQAEEIVFHDRPYSLILQIPPLSMMIFKPIIEPENDTTSTTDIINATSTTNTVSCKKI